MSAILVEIPADVEGPLEQQASVLNVDAGDSRADVKWMADNTTVRK